jgi:POT family proton-dependent oligopeptide transporter
VDIAAKLKEVKVGFHRSFWVANIMELFERLAYYGQQIVFMVYMRNKLGFSEAQAGSLSGIFGGLIYLLPILGGTLADKWGFRKAFTVCFTVLAIGYFLIGSVGMPAFSGIYANLDHYWLIMLFLIFTSLGGCFIKPSVLGTVALGSKPETKSLGFAIYYWLVNVGAMIGPTIAYLIRDSIGYEYVYMVSAISCLAMLIVNLTLYRNIKSEIAEPVESLAKKIENLFVVLANYKFMIFLLIYSLYWIIFWQEFIVIPYYVTDFIGKNTPYEIIQSWGGAGAIILFQIPVNRLTKNFSTEKAILTGFFISSMIWVIIAIHPSIPMIAAGVVAFSIGEMTQAPRYYEYISEIAPVGQQGLYQGYAFLPIAIARFVGDPIGGWLYETAKAKNNMSLVWFSLIGIGFLSTALMFLYNKYLAKPKTAE